MKKPFQLLFTLGNVNDHFTNFRPTFISAHILSIICYIFIRMGIFLTKVAKVLYNYISLDFSEVLQFPK